MIPKVVAHRREDGPGWRVWCFFCRSWHAHHALGAQAAGCEKRTPYSREGYELVPAWRLALPTRWRCVAWHPKRGQVEVVVSVGAQSSYGAGPSVLLTVEGSRHSEYEVQVTPEQIPGLVDALIRAYDTVRK
jgi:hypothetical protein